MKTFTIKEKEFVPASHEDPRNPGALKIILGDSTLVDPNSHLQMINWAKIPVGRHFESHYHEDMDEIFIMVEGICETDIQGEKKILEKGDGVVVPMKSLHMMKNIGTADAYYLAIGFSLGKGGKTVNG